MSVSSNVEFNFSVTEQVDVAKTYKFKLNGRGQADTDIVSLMNINSDSKKIEFWNCFCEDDFDTIVPDMSNYIAERVPNSDFTCTAHFLNEVGGEGIDYEIIYKDGKLDIGYCEYGDDDNDDNGDAFDDLLFVISGRLKIFSNREELEEYICDQGYEVSSRISSETSYLICNDKESTSSKVAKARNLNIPIINEEEFIRRYGEPSDFDLDEYEKEKPYKHNIITIR